MEFWHWLIVAASTDGGSTKSNDAVWLVERPDLPSGTRIRVTGADSTLLRVAQLCPDLSRRTACRHALADVNVKFVRRNMLRRTDQTKGL
jgi:hypothetical protein